MNSIMPVTGQELRALNASEIGLVSGGTGSGYGGFTMPSITVSPNISVPVEVNVITQVVAFSTNVNQAAGAGNFGVGGNIVTYTKKH